MSQPQPQQPQPPPTIPTTMGDVPVHMPVMPVVPGVPTPPHIPTALWFVLAILGLAPQLFFSWAAYNQSRQNHEQAAETKKVVEDTKDATDRNHTLMNSRFTEFADLIEKASFAEGVKDERDRAATRPTQTRPQPTGARP